MANSENKQGAVDEVSRVHKASEVHKRRASSTSVGASAPAAQSTSTGEAAPVEAPTQATASLSADERPEEAPSQQDSPSASGEQLVAGQDETESQGGERADGQGEAEAGEAEPVDAAAPKNRLVKRIVGIALGIVAAALLVFAGFMAGSRWVRFNDEADLQGKWFVYGTEVPLTIENGVIVINEDTSYSYHIDPTAKTIEYTFGNLEGRGRYWFNDDRDILVITDGADYTMWSTLTEDLTHWMGSLFGNADLPTTDDSIVLTRTVVQAPPASSQNGAEGSSATSSESSGEESSDTLMVSDIMMKEDADEEG